MEPARSEQGNAVNSYDGVESANKRSLVPCWFKKGIDLESRFKNLSATEVELVEKLSFV